MTNKPRETRLVLIGLLLLCGWLVYDRQQLKKQLLTKSPPAVESLAEVTRPLTDQLTVAKARSLAKFYLALEDVLERDTTIVTTTGQFRAAHGRALALAFRSTPTSGEPHVGDLVDAVFFKALGAQDREIDDAVRMQLLAAQFLDGEVE